MEQINRAKEHIKRKYEEYKNLKFQEKLNIKLKNELYLTIFYYISWFIYTIVSKNPGTDCYEVSEEDNWVCLDNGDNYYDTNGDLKTADNSRYYTIESRMEGWGIMQILLLPALIIVLFTMYCIKEMSDGFDINNESHEISKFIYEYISENASWAMISVYYFLLGWFRRFLKDCCDETLFANDFEAFQYFGLWILFLTCLCACTPERRLVWLGIFSIILFASTLISIINLCKQGLPSIGLPSTDVSFMIIPDIVLIFKILIFFASLIFQSYQYLHRIPYLKFEDKIIN